MQFCKRESLLSGVDEEIVNINYIVKDSQKLLGVARNRITRMCSVDGGDTWFSISQQQYAIEVADIANLLKVGL